MIIPSGSHSSGSCPENAAVPWDCCGLEVRLARQSRTVPLTARRKGLLVLSLLLWLETDVEHTSFGDLRYTD